MCDKGESDNPRFIIPEVQPPSQKDHFDLERESALCYDELPTSDRGSRVSSLEDSEASFAHDSAIVAENDEATSADLIEDSLAWEKAKMNTWGRRLRRCSCSLKVIALLFMLMSAWALIFPPRLEHFAMKFMQQQNHH